MEQSHKGAQLSDITSNIPDFFVLKINKEVNRMIEDGMDVIRLNLGKSEFPMPDYVTKEIVDKMNDGELREIVNPQGILPLREEIAKHYSESYNLNVSPDSIFINNGTSPFFLALFLLISNVGDKILFPRPYYPTYVASANMVKAQSTFYSITDGRIDLDELKANFVPGETKIVFLNSPGNPFGNVISKEELQEIVDFVDGRAYIISDEIYDAFTYDNDFASILEVADPERDKVVVLNGFSKIHRMYTRRLGYAIVPDEMVPSLLKFQQYTLVCVDPVTQFGGLIAIKNRTDIIKQDIRKEVGIFKQRLEESRKLLEDTKVKIINPAGSFYMSVDVSEYLNDEIPSALVLAEKILENAHVAVTPGRDFGVDGVFRISLTSPRVVNGIERMCDYLKTL